MKRSSFLTATTLALAFSAIAPAQENLELGKMWTFENPPLAYLKDEYGFTPNQAWFDALRLASIRFGTGCSSSFVSPKGLIMTNHHCIRDKIAEVQGEHDWVKNGYYAKTLEDEVAIPGLTVQQLVEMKDITAAMNADIKAGMSDKEVAQTRDLNKGKIIKAAKDANPDLSPEVVTLFQGAIYQLYSYKVYDDIRLVCAPHLQTAHFGGDPDNFTYPRYGIDFSFARAYEDDKPVDTSSHYFKWKTSGPVKGELVFSTGNPGTTKRLLTLDQMKYMRDAHHPIVNQFIDSKLAIRRKVVADKPELEKEMRTDILSWENSQKAYNGYHAGLLEESMMEQKASAEAAFKQKVFANEDLRAKYGAAWGKLAKVAATRTQLEAKLRFQTPAGHPVLGAALMTVLGRKPQAFAAAEAKTTDLQRLEFIDHLKRAQKWLPKDDPYMAAVLGNRTPEETADLLEKSKLCDPEFLKALFEDSELIGKSEEPALVMARAFLPLMRDNQRLNAQLEAVETAQGALIGQALHATYGNSVSPDATFTLRFSDGVVKGYGFNGTIAPYRTTFHGLFARNIEFDGVYPFNLPKEWLEKKDLIDMTRSVDMVSTNDIIGGNSGSPLVNANLEVVGLIFDGNIEMLPNRYVYRGNIPRTVSATAEAITECLEKIYDADRILKELTAHKGQ